MINIIKRRTNICLLYIKEYTINWQTLVFLFNLNFGGIVFLEKLYEIMLEIDWVYLFLGFVNLEGQVLAPPLFWCTFFFIINLMGLVY